MKKVILLALVITTSAYAAKETVRKVSSSSYSVCHLERENVDKRVFKKDYHFPFPTEKDETYELKGSMRWNNYKIVLSQTGEVKVTISEYINGELVEASKIHKLGKEPQFESFKIQIELKKDDIAIPYNVSCSPE